LAVAALVFQRTGRPHLAFSPANEPNRDGIFDERLPNILGGVKVPQCRLAVAQQVRGAPKQSFSGNASPTVATWTARRKKIDDSTSEPSNISPAPRRKVRAGLRLEAS